MQTVRPQLWRVATLNVQSLIARWTEREGGQERANYVLFLTELCDALGLPHPDPAGTSTAGNDYVFERPVRGDRGAPLRIDLYKRDCFVLEAKQSLLDPRKPGAAAQAELFTAAEQADALGGGARRWDVLMTNAFKQAWNYAARLEADHDRPPFLLVVDVGRAIDVYADFSGQGRNYRRFPDARRCRIRLEDLAGEDVQALLRDIWTDPRARDPARRRAEVTREIAGHLAEVSRGLERRGAPPEEAAAFLMRCLFAMFAESVGLLTTKAGEGRRETFRDQLRLAQDNPASFMPLATQLFEAMDEGLYAFALTAHVRRFNGAFYKQRRAFPLEREEIGALIEAAGADWANVEPAIFGTLLERALSPADRSRLGAHYTPRAYVERLVTATVIEPLRADWAAAQSAADRLRATGDLAGARAAVLAFHTQLTRTRVLDPACGTGNFLYVALLLIKELEGDVLDAFADLADEANLKEFATLVVRGVDPRQFLGLELNPRAAAIAELVLWIGYLQASLRRGDYAPRDPVLEAHDTINGRAFRRAPTEPVDAVLRHDGPIVGGGGTAYPGPRRPDWPEAHFIVGNPPFIGGKDLRAEQGDAYAQALWAAHPGMNDSADLVMYWWDRAADILTRPGTVLRRFGFVTTNSITQVFQRRTVQKWLAAQKGDRSPLSLVFAVADHPWTKAARDSAAVRIAMTVAQAGEHEGVLLTVAREAALDTDQPEIETRAEAGRINADLTVGVDLASARGLLANEGLCSRGVSLHGAGFIVSPAEAAHLGLGRADRPGLEAHVRPYRNGRDVTGRSRGKLVIDLFGLEERDVRRRFPEVHQHLTQTVKEDRRKVVARSPTRDAQEYLDRWWLFGKPRSELRPALSGLLRYIVTVETAKHRVFQFLQAEVLPDNMLVAIASDEAAHLAVLSSRVHGAWALAAGGWLGVGNDPRYSKSRCFDPFPFPDLAPHQRAELAALGEELDAFRRARLAEHPELTMTRLYNALEAVRAHDLDAACALTPQEAADAQAGSVRGLAAYHDDIDRLTLAAYALAADADGQALLARLVALNAERAAEEARGRVRWLRPDYQRARFGRGEVAGPQLVRDLVGAPAAAKGARPPFPADLTRQHIEVWTALARSPVPLSAADIAARWRGREVAPKVEAALRALARLGEVQVAPGGAYALRRAA